MLLPDFNEFEPFNQLRSKMQANEQGYFELFDPNVHLTGVERSKLARTGMRVPPTSIYHLLDFTLGFKNSRIVVVDGSTYHLARCEQISEQSEYLVASASRALNSEVTVCRACLQKLHFDGYDSVKARRQAYSESVWQTFSLEKFWQKYPVYPISEKRNARKSLVDQE